VATRSFVWLASLLIGYMEQHNCGSYIAFILAGLELLFGFKVLANWSIKASMNCSQNGSIFDYKYFDMP